MRRIEDFGYKVIPATKEEDCIDKIDAHIEDNKGFLHTAQIKYRENSTQILVEVCKLKNQELSFNTIFNGRDMISKAELYICLIKEDLWFIESSEIKFYVNLLCHTLIEKHLKNSLVTRYDKEGMTAKITFDAQTLERKILFYATPNRFQTSKCYKRF